MRLLNVDSLEEARKKLLSAAEKTHLQTERVPFAKAIGRILAKDLKAEENVPNFRKSTVDGYAVRAADTAGVTENIPVFLDVVEEIQMGHAPLKNLEPGQATYVPTGGMLPVGADAVVMIEYCEKFDENSIAVYDSVSVGRNLIAEGEDLSKGQIFLKKGICLRPQEIGVMSSAGVIMPEVFKKWGVTIISTGDEIVSAEQVPDKGQVRDVNTYAVSTAAEKNGFNVIRTMVIKDDEKLLAESVKSAMADSDMVVVSGGSSQGEKDYTAKVMDALGNPGVFTHGIALKPGKPTILGYDEDSNTVLMGLPGHPAAALMVFDLMACWLYRKLTGQKDPVSIPVKITENVASAGGRTTCLPVALECNGDIPEACPVLGKSGVMMTLARADGYVIIPADNEGLTKGQYVKAVLF